MLSDKHVNSASLPTWSKPLKHYSDGVLRKYKREKKEHFVTCRIRTYAPEGTASTATNETLGKETLKNSRAAR